MSELIEIDVNKVENMSTAKGLGEASARFCYAAVGLPNDVVAGFLELIESYSESCKYPQGADGTAQTSPDFS